MKKPRTSVTKCMTLRFLYTSSLTGLLTECFPSFLWHTALNMRAF
ncbi:hypothetical protein T01_1152 [Trichinella spiralis]|uniref:Uncharacterized protein n=1 Tax=Trichinella spiralis TaxID=6334 RepID=A0A0V0XDV6_TRISP|nr:hypothetical protein T01_1152 [Trichinella spiralis]